MLLFILLSNPHLFSVLASYLRECRAPLATVLKVTWKSLRIPIEMSRTVPTVTFDLFLMEYISSYISDNTAEMATEPT